MKNKIPDRWLDYTPMGFKVAGTRFIAFKAPLSKEICAKMKPAERFTPDILMERCPNMRLIIDLTNTDRYYNKQNFIDRGIQYEKIMCPGQIIPPQSLIFRFFEIIDDFYLKNGLKDVLIGIHCTHGVNRTGYFIGRYMVQRMGFHYEKAIPCIEEARGHKIERTNYIKDLMVQIPIPSSLSSSSGKKIIDAKNDSKKGPSNSSAKSVGKMPSERTPERQYRRPLPESRDPPGKPSHRRSPEPGFRPKDLQGRQGNYGANAGRQISPVRRGASPPVRRAPSPSRRGFSPNRRPPSPGRRGGRGPSPKRFRSPPRTFSPPRRRTPPPRRSPPRRMSPPRRDNDFGASSHRLSDRDFPNRSTGGPNRGYSPPRRAEPHSSNFTSRSHDQNYGPPTSSNPPWQPPYEDRNFNSGGPSSSYGPPQSQFSDSRQPERRSWDSGRNNQPSFNHSRPPHGNSGPAQWNHPPPNTFSAPPPAMNVPPPNFDSRSSGFTSGPPSGRFNERRSDEPKFQPGREESKRPWNESRSSNVGHSFTSGRFDDSRGFSDRGNDHRMRPEEKYEKPYRSPPRDYPRDKRPPSPAREYPRDFDSGHSRQEAPWDSRKRSPEPFGDYVRGGRRRSRSPDVRRPSPRNRPGDFERGPRRRSRSPPDPRMTDRASRIDLRRSPPRSRQADMPSSTFNTPSFDGPTPRPGVEPPYQDKRFYDSRDDCRDLLNQKRHFDGSDRPSGDFYSEPKPSNKLDVRGIPKEVDLRKVIRGGIPEAPLKDRLGPPPRDEVADMGRRGRSRSPRARSPPRYGAGPTSRRY